MSTSVPTVFEEKRVGTPFTAPVPGTTGTDSVIKSGELLVLDPSSIDPTRMSFDLTPYVAGPQGPDWGDAELTQYLADSGRIGQTSIDFKIPNRTIVVPLAIQDRGLGLTYDQVRTSIQRKVGTLQWQGGWLRRATTMGNVYAEVIGASLKFGGSTLEATQRVDTDAQLTLICLPEWVGDEVYLSATQNQVYTGFASQTYTGIKGDFPGRMRVLLTEQASNDQRGLIWGTRSIDYVSDATAKTQYEAEDLSLLGTATVVASATASNGHAVQISNIPTSTGNQYNPTWTGVINTSSVNGDMNHIGSYRVWARCQATGPANAFPTVAVRLTWDVGDLIVGTSNTPAWFPNGVDTVPLQPISSFNGWYLLDLGQVRLDKAPIGVHRWEGTVEVMSLGGFTVVPNIQGVNVPSYGGAQENILIDEIFIVPVDEGYGTLSTSAPGDAVMYAHQAMELRTDGAYRLATSGNNYGPINKVLGDLPRLPISGLEGRTVEFFVKPTQSDLNTKPDPTVDLFGLQVLYRPSYLFVSE